MVGLEPELLGLSSTNLTAMYQKNLYSAHIYQTTRNSFPKVGHLLHLLAKCLIYRLINIVSIKPTFSSQTNIHGLLCVLFLQSLLGHVTERVYYWYRDGSVFQASTFGWSWRLYDVIALKMSAADSGVIRNSEVTASYFNHPSFL